MQQLFKRVVCASIVVSLAACAGSPHGIRSASPVVPIPAQTMRATAKISIKIPHRNDPRAVARYYGTSGHSRDYVSPATQSIAISVSDSSNRTTTTGAALTLAPAGSQANPTECTSTALSTLCTVTLVLDPGTYSVSFATYDGPLGANGKPTGNVLSMNQNVPFTVLAGKDNALVVSLAGVPGSVSIVPAATEKLVRGSGAPVYSLVALGAVHAFNVFAFDADGDPIVGPGAPTWSFGDTGPTADFVITEPTAATPNTFTIKTVVPVGGGSPSDPKDTSGIDLTVTAMPPAGSGASCTAVTCSKTVMIDTIDAAFVGYTGGTSMFVEGELESFADSAIGASTSTVDRNTGIVYFANAHTVYQWKPPYDAAPTLLFDEPGIPAISDLSIDPNGVLYYVGAQPMSPRYDVYRAAPPYDGHGIFLNGFTFSDTSHDYHNRILADANGHVIVAADDQIFFTDTGKTHQQSIAAIGPFITFDGSGEIVAYDSQAGTLSSYVFNDATGKYGLAVTNKMVNGAPVIPLRGEANHIYALFDNPTSLASFTVPLSTGAPDTVALAFQQGIDDYAITTNEGGVISISYGSIALAEMTSFGLGDTVTAFLGVTPSTLTIVR